MKKFWYFPLSFAFFVLISVFLFRNVIDSPGVILGGDWCFPVTQIQVKRLIGCMTSSWNDTVLLGSRNLTLTSLPFGLFVALSSFLGIPPFQCQRIILVLLFTFAGYTTYDLLLFLRVHRLVALFGGVFYITSPVIFNYTLMGWIFVLFAMGLLPIACKYFIRAVQENRVSFALLTGILYALAMIQSQSLFWFIIVFIILGLYLIHDRASLLGYAKMLGIVCACFLLVSSYWLLGLVFVPEQVVYGSRLVQSAGSLGTMGHFYPLNILRLFGSLFNFQYESILKSADLSALSLLLPLMAASPLLATSHKRLIVALWLIGLVPALMFALDTYRELLLCIPFSNVIRDFPRFSIMSAFAYSILVGFFVNLLYQPSGENRTCKRIALLSCLTVWFLLLYPWWSGEFTSWQHGKGPDFRLRTKVFHGDYYKMERLLDRQKMDYRAVFMPVGGTVSMHDDPKFLGLHKEVQDIFAAYSPVPGVLVLSDKSLGHSDAYLRMVAEHMRDDPLGTLRLTNVRLFVLRKNLMENWKPIIRSLEREVEHGRVSRLYAGEKIVVYSRNMFLPHIFVSSG